MSVGTNLTLRSVPLGLTIANVLGCIIRNLYTVKDKMLDTEKG